MKPMCALCREYPATDRDRLPMCEGCWAKADKRVAAGLVHWPAGFGGGVAMAPPRVPTAAELHRPADAKVH